MLAAGFGALREDYVEWARPLASIQGYLDKSYSSLHLIPADAFERATARLRADFERGPVQGLSMYILCGVRRGAELDIRAYNREAWNRQVEQGNQWTVPVSSEQVTAARRGDWSVVLQTRKPFHAVGFPIRLPVWTCCAWRRAAGSRGRSWRLPARG